MNDKYFLFAGLFLVLIGVGLRIVESPAYLFFLIPGIGLKVVFLVSGILDGRLAGGRYLALLFAGVVLVGCGSYMKSTLMVPLLGQWFVWTGFLFKAVSIVFMVVVGRRRNMAKESCLSKHRSNTRF